MLEANKNAQRFTIPRSGSNFGDCMKVDKEEEHLVIRQSTAVIEGLNLQKGNDIQSEVAGVRNFEINKKPDARELLARLRKYRGRLPTNFKFNRLEANARG